MKNQASPMRGRPREADGERIDRHITKHRLQKEAGSLWVTNYWFETDGYGAAVAGILGSIELGLRSGSIGVGMETNILKEVARKLQRMDPDIAVTKEMVE